MSATLENLNADGQQVLETRARRQIRIALEVLGATWISIRWEPVGQMIEMSGREGGWTVFARLPGVRYEVHFLGYSASEVLEQIAEWIMTKPAIWGRYDAQYHARLACQRFEDQPGAHPRVRYMPSERYPEFPHVLAIYDWGHEADQCDAEGEVRR